MQYRKMMSLNEDGFYVEKIGVCNGFPTPPCDTVILEGQRFHNRFFYIVNGTINFELKKDKLITASAGDIVYLPCGASYHSWWDDVPNSEYITMVFEMFDNSGEEISLNEEIVVLHKDTSNKFYDILHKMNSIYNARMVNWNLLLKSHFYNFISRLMYELYYHQMENSNFSSEINKGIVYLENHYMKNVSIKELADKSNVSESTFRRNFIKIKGVSPVMYRNDLRLQHAYDFLYSGLFTVTEVAEMVGFDDVPYFSKSFKKKYGITPTDCIGLSKNIKE